ncbi:MAG TPA: NUDIX domain-containing protein [Acidimicrobiia bacterium]|nr:NUDIX domain-containing protein [Acidimicrobiia bacterium]
MATGTVEPILRPSGRVILIGPGDVTLLFRGGDPHRPADGTWWFTPGGGTEGGESTFEAARRELWEETGQRDVEWYGLVARREAVFSFMGQTYRSIEEFYLARAHSLAVDLHGLTELEVEAVEEHRWLDPDSLVRLSDPVYPVALADHLVGLIGGELPSEPWIWE